MAAGGEDPTGLVHTHYQILVEHCQVFITCLLSIKWRVLCTLRQDLSQAWMAFQRPRHADFESRVSLPDARDELGQVLLNMEPEGQEVGHHHDSLNALAGEVGNGARQVR